jgi:rod shape-determining protein MreC
MNVIAGNGLVGIVYEVSDHYAKVRSVINDTSMVSAMVLSTQDNCIVKGSKETMNKGYLEVVYLAKDSKIKKGDELVTSNISSKFVEGITIGTVTKVQKSTDGLTKTARIEPIVDFQHLKEVLVIKTVKESVVLDETVKE